MEDKLKDLEESMVTLAQYIPPGTAEASLEYLFKSRDILDAYERSIQDGITQEDCDKIKAAVYFATK